MRFFAAFLVICCSQVWAQTTGAVLKASGPVLLNGKQVTRSLALLDADKIETLSTVASITQPGASVLIGAKSQIAYSKDGLILSSGSAVIVASTPFTTHVNGATLKPQTGKARFAVRETPCSIQIAALEGGISVNDGARDVILGSGEFLSLPLLKSVATTGNKSNPTATRSAVAPDCDQTDTAPQTAGKPAPPSDTPGDVFIWATTSASSSALVMLLVQDQRPPVSPQAP